MRHNVNIDLWQITPTTYRAAPRPASPQYNICCAVCNNSLQGVVAIWYSIPIDDIHAQCRSRYSIDIAQNIIHGTPTVRVPVHLHCVKTYIPSQHCEDIDKLIGLCIMTVRKEERNGQCPISPGAGGSHS